MTTQIPATMSEVTAAIERLLSERGPMTAERVQTALIETGIDLGLSPDDTLNEALESDDLPAVTYLADERHAALPALLDGRVFTHRVTSLEATHDLVTLQPDLDPVAMLLEVERYRRTDDGAPLAIALPDYDDEDLIARGVPIDEVDSEGVLLLPQGRFTELGIAADDLVAFRVTEGLALARLDPPAPEAMADRLHPAVDRLVPAGADRPEMLTTLIWTACADDPDLFARPSVPLTDLLEAVGLERYGDWVAPTGFDFTEWRLSGRTDHIARAYGLEEDPALAVVFLAQTYDHAVELFDAAKEAEESGEGLDELFGPAEADKASGEEGSEPDLRPIVDATLPFLADADVARGVLGETLGVGAEGAGALGIFAETLEQQAPPEARPALRWLRAIAHERLGNVAEAEEALHAAEEMDPTFAPALVDLARYASDRGDAERGLALLHRAHEPHDELVEVLENARSEPRKDLGRNQPCWCGSGRKYKKCHLGRETPPLSERAGWLYHKATTYADRGPYRYAILEAAQERSRHFEDGAALLAALQDPLVLDAVLFEGGAFEQFLADRGMLLPEDEQLLAQQWVLSGRSVYEVESVRAGHGLTLRDLRTGDRVEVTERTGSRELRAGMLICVHVLPVGETWQIFGGIEPVAAGQQEDLMRLLDEKPEPDRLVAYLSRRFAPPEMANTEGDPMVLCEATLAVPDPEALATALDEAYDRQECDGDDDQEWIEHVVTEGLTRVRATLRLAGDRLHVDTNSEARMDRVLAAIRDLQPDVTVTEDSRRPAADVQEAMRRAPEKPGEDSAGVDPSDPQIAEALVEFTRQHERKWLDDSIPALGGYTPRQAADDPTRREDLIRLLDSFPETGYPGSMSPARLREALGLPAR